MRNCFYILLVILVFLFGCSHSDSPLSGKTLDTDIVVTSNVNADGTFSFVGNGEFSGVSIYFNDKDLAGKKVLIKKAKVKKTELSNIYVVSDTYFIFIEDINVPKILKGRFTFPISGSSYILQKDIMLREIYENKVLYINGIINSSGISVDSIFIPGEFNVVYSDNVSTVLENRVLFLKSMSYNDYLSSGESSSGVHNVKAGESLILYIDKDQVDGLVSINWSIEEKPDMSNTQLQLSRDLYEGKLIPDLNGVYKVKVNLVLSGGSVISDTVKIIATEYNTRPTNAYCGICHSGVLQSMGKSDFLGRNNLRDIFTSWSLSKHGQTNINISDSSCNKCHKVGFQNNISCEACHGPSGTFVSGHPETTDRNSQVCITCHNVGEGNLSNHSFIYTNAHENSNKLIKNSNKECLVCHTSEGFLSSLYQSNKTIGYYKGISCVTCHDPHDEKNNLKMLRTMDNITLISGNNISKNVVAKKGAICYYCHGMSPVSNGVLNVNINLNKIPHNTQVEMLEGVGGFDYGNNIRKSLHGYLQNRCVDCHLQFGGSNKLHSFDMKSEPNKYLAYCNNTVCHSATNVQFVGGHFDVDGRIENILVLKNQLKTKINRILKRSDNATLSLDYSLFDISNELKNALKYATYNYYFVHNDRSNGVHNYLYAKGLLEASIADLNKYTGE